MGDPGLPDDWHRFYSTCEQCGKTYHTSGVVECDCRPCEGCDELVAPSYECKKCEERAAEDEDAEEAAKEAKYDEWKDKQLESADDFGIWSD